MLPWARYAANACVIVLLVQEHMLLNASEGEISSAVEHEAKLRKMPHVASKVHRQLGSSKAHTAGYCPVEHCHLLQAPKSRDKDGDETTQRKVKEAQKEELDRQNRAQTNQALAAAGGRARWQNFGKPKGKPTGAAAPADSIVLSMCMCSHSCTISIQAALLWAAQHDTSSKGNTNCQLAPYHMQNTCSYNRSYACSQERCSKTSLRLQCPHLQCGCCQHIQYYTGM